ncbi:MAG: YraN family protein [Minisyncoccia bacterium]
MPKKFTSESQKVGEIGENVAVKFLMKHNFLILERNFTEKWGEIDVIAEKDNKIHFVEVKSVSKQSLEMVTPASTNSSLGGHETLDQYHPEDNMHPWKQKRLSRTIQTYLLSKKVPNEKEWQVDLLVVFLSLKDKKAKIKVVSDVIL